MVWSGRGAMVLAIAVVGSGCSVGLTEEADAGGRPPPLQADAGTTADASAVGDPDAGVPDATWPLAKTYPLTAGPVDAIQLAANEGAVFGLTSHNGVWTLAAGDSDVRFLVAPGDGRISWTAWGASLVAAGTDLYWLDRAAATLHRTRADGSADDILASGLAEPDTLAVDDTRIYWGESSTDGGFVRSLPRDATPGDAPATLVSAGSGQAISSLAASAGKLYWTSFTAVGATVYYATLFAASTDDLMRGGSGAAIDGNNPYGVTTAGGAVFCGDHRDMWTTALMGLSSTATAPNLLSILPIDVGLKGIAVTGSWLIVTGAAPTVGTDLYVAPRMGAGLVRVAQGLRTPAVVGPAGITFVDASGALVFIKTGDLGYVGFGHPAP